jgi:hypothetical protein
VVEDVPVLAMLGLLTPMKLAPKHKRTHPPLASRQRRFRRARAGAAIVVRRTDEVERARERSERYARLRDKWVVSNPDIFGGTR